MDFTYIIEFFLSTLILLIDGMTTRLLTVITRLETIFQKPLVQGLRNWKLKAKKFVLKNSCVKFFLSLYIVDKIFIITKIRQKKEDTCSVLLYTDSKGKQHYCQKEKDNQLEYCRDHQISSASECIRYHRRNSWEDSTVKKFKNKQESDRKYEKVQKQDELIRQANRLVGALERKKHRVRFNLRRDWRHQNRIKMLENTYPDYVVSDSKVDFSQLYKYRMIAEQKEKKRLQKLEEQKWRSINIDIV